MTESEQAPRIYLEQSYVTDGVYWLPETGRLLPLMTKLASQLLSSIVSC